MTDNARLVLARIAAEIKKGSSSADVLQIVAEIYRRQVEADEAIALAATPPNAKGSSA